MDEDWEILLTYADVLNKKNSNGPDPADGAATLRAMAAKYGG